MGKTALVTGASRGIGKAIAIKLAKEGYALHLTCKNSIEQLEDLAKELSETYRVKVQTYACDMADAKAVEELFVSISQLDVLINNAGISRIGLVQDTSVQTWMEVMQTNLSSAFFTSRKAIPFFLKEGNGRILNISSVWGASGASMEVAYSASKGGLNTFTKALARELAPSGIPVNALACGVIDTQMNAFLSEEDRDALLEEIPMGRMASPEEVADMVFCMLQMPVYVTGQIITMDGGWV